MSSSMGGENGGDGPPTASSLMGLLDDLHQARLNVENDQKAYEQSRQELKKLDKELKSFKETIADLNSKVSEGEKNFALKSSELSHVKIKEKVILEALEFVNLDLNKGWDDLRIIRSKGLILSSRYLNECKKFAVNYNCTEMGAQNRAEEKAKLLEDTRLRKHQLEFDLQQFLTMKAKVEKSEQENKELEHQYRLQEGEEQQKEMEAYSKLEEAEKKIDQLKNQLSAMDSKFQEELERAQAKLKTTQESISYWERRVSENQRKVSNQKSMTCNANNSVNIGTSPGINGGVPLKPTINPNQIKLANGQIVTTNNKSPRPHFVRPTIQSKPSKNSENIPPPQKSIQTRLQFSNPSLPTLVKPVRFAPQASSTSASSPLVPQFGKFRKNNPNFSTPLLQPNKIPTTAPPPPIPSQLSNNSLNNSLYNCSGSKFQFKKKPDVSANNRQLNVKSTPRHIAAPIYNTNQEDQSQFDDDVEFCSYNFDKNEFY